MVAATFTASAFGQKLSGGPTATAAAAPIYPHDFSDSFYLNNGVKVAAIKGRLTGSDFLSVIEKTAHPNYSSVRALITLPAYTENGDLRFWNPFGTVNINYLSDNARNLATRHVVYVLPAPTMKPGISPFADLRQAVIFDDASQGYADEANPLGLRFIVTVTPIAPKDAKGKTVLEEMANKNGRAADGRPLVKSLSDLQTLSVYGLIEMSKGTGEVAIAPVLNEQNGIAKDAFLSMAMNNGKPLEGETVFAAKFQCLQSSTACY